MIQAAWGQVRNQSLPSAVQSLLVDLAPSRLDQSEGFNDVKLLLPKPLYGHFGLAVLALLKAVSKEGFGMQFLKVRNNLLIHGLED